MKSYRRKDNARLKALREEGQRIINDTMNAINGKWPIISEMAIPLKKYAEKIESFKYEFAKNWCLCKWCQMFDPGNENFNHWKEELFNCLDQLSSPKLKNNIGKKKHLEKYLVEWYDLDEKDMVLDVIDYKFDKEHIMDISQRNAVADAFANGIHVLIDAMSDGHDACKSYIANTFGA